MSDPNLKLRRALLTAPYRCPPHNIYEKNSLVYARQYEDVKIEIDFSLSVLCLFTEFNP